MKKIIIFISFFVNTLLFSETNTAILLIEDMCNNDNNIVMCGTAGMTYLSGKDGTKKNIPKAIKYLTKACDGKSARGCNNLGNIYEFTKNDYSSSYHYYSVACKNNNSTGCYNTGRSYQTGRGVEKDIFEAKNFYEKACKLKHGRACYALGFMYAKGNGARQNMSIAKEYFGKACDNAEADGCKAYSALNENGI